MNEIWFDDHARNKFSNFKEIRLSENWFRAYEIKPDLIVFHEPGHYEQTLVNLVIGKDKALLIDTGCGIGDLDRVVKDVTDKPVMVVNTHSHNDHLGSNHQFDEIGMFEHPLSQQVAERGVPRHVLQKEILAETLISNTLPERFDPRSFHIPPLKVSHWLKDSDWIDLGNRKLMVIHTPGEAPDHICLLDITDRLLFCGDILLHGAIWTHLEGGSLTDLINSYHKLMKFLDQFDYLMPSHNEPWLDKNYLLEALNGAEAVASGEAEYTEIIDPWGRRLRQYPFERIELLTGANTPMI